MAKREKGSCHTLKVLRFMCRYLMKYTMDLVAHWEHLNNWRVNILSSLYGITSFSARAGLHPCFLNSPGEMFSNDNCWMRRRREVFSSSKPSTKQNGANQRS